MVRNQQGDQVTFIWQDQMHEIRKIFLRYRNSILASSEHKISELLRRMLNDIDEALKKTHMPHTDEEPDVDYSTLTLYREQMSKIRAIFTRHWSAIIILSASIVDDLLQKMLDEIKIILRDRSTDRHSFYQVKSFGSEGEPDPENIKEISRVTTEEQEILDKIDKKYDPLMKHLSEKDPKFWVLSKQMDEEIQVEMKKLKHQK